MTPTQRAIRQLGRSMLLTACVTGFYAVGAAIAGGTTALNWEEVAFAFILGASFSIAHSILAYLEPSYPNEANFIAHVVDALQARIVSHAPAPLQGGFQGAFQGPLVVVHAMQPQNGATMSVAPDASSVHPNVQPTGQVLSETNPATPQA